VDEFAHTNMPGSRHEKRWQDINELLDAGIDVFTTMNIQHLESKAVVDLTSIATKPYVQHQIKKSQKSLPALYPSVESKSVAISVALYLALHSLGNLFGPCSDLHT
jgi:hypothetical protein